MRKRFSDMKKITAIFLMCLILAPNAFCQSEDDSEGAETESKGVFASIKEQFSKSDEDEVVITHLLSLDFMLLAMQLSNLGIGFGVQYERQIFPHHAIKGYFGHAVINTHYEDTYCVTVSFGLFAEWYPLSRQMRKLYVGVGSYFDYLSYESNKIPEDATGEMLSVIPQIGYKFSLPWHLLLDVNCGYKYAYQMDGEAYGNAVNYLKRGFQYGVSLKRVIKQ